MGDIQATNMRQHVGKHRKNLWRKTEMKLISDEVGVIGFQMLIIIAYCAQQTGASINDQPFVGPLVP